MELDSRKLREDLKKSNLGHPTALHEVFSKL